MIPSPAQVGVPTPNPEKGKRVVETAREFWSKGVKEEFRGIAVGDLDWNNVAHREMVKHTDREDAQRIYLLRMARKRG